MGNKTASTIQRKRVEAAYALYVGQPTCSPKGMKNEKQGLFVILAIPDHLVASDNNHSFSGHKNGLLQVRNEFKDEVRTR